MAEEIAIELAILEREAHARIAAKRAAEQLGEAFRNLESTSEEGVTL